MGYLIALIPAVCWGIIPLFTTKVGGSSSNQVFGIGLGALIVSIISMLLMRPSIDLVPFIVAVISGACWSVGQFGQFASMKKIGVSNTMPLSTAFQLIGNTLIGVCIFREWTGTKQVVIGFIALALVVIGAMLTSITGNHPWLHCLFCFSTLPSAGPYGFHCHLLTRNDRYSAWGNNFPIDD